MRTFTCRSTFLYAPITLITYCVVVRLSDVRISPLPRALAKATSSYIQSYCVVVLLGNVQESLVQGLGKTYVLFLPLLHN